MKKLTLFAATCMFAAFSFAQDAGQWSFGAGGNFTAPNAEANIGYFAIDGLMLSFNFNMNMDHEVATYVMEDDGTGTGDMVATDAVDFTTTVEGDMKLGCGIRYYAVDNMFIEASMSTATDAEVDIAIAGGVSLELGFDGRLWFEPMIRYSMPGEEYSTDGGNESQSSMGLAWAFRYTF